MVKQIVIDTNIWVKSICDKEFDYDCDMALHKFMADEEQVLVLDENGVIDREYRDNVKGKRFEIMMRELERKQKKTFVSGKIDNKHKKRLLEIGFHEEEDHVFVGVAMNSGKMIVTEDSDYGAKGEEGKQAVFTYMKDEMGLHVLSAKEYNKLGE